MESPSLFISYNFYPLKSFACQVNPVRKERADSTLNKELMLLLLQVFPPSPAYLSADRQEC